MAPDHSKPTCSSCHGKPGRRDLPGITVGAVEARASRGDLEWFKKRPLVQPFAKLIFGCLKKLGISEHTRLELLEQSIGLEADRGEQGARYAQLRQRAGSEYISFVIGERRGLAPTTPG